MNATIQAPRTRTRPVQPGSTPAREVDMTPENDHPKHNISGVVSYVMTKRTSYGNTHEALDEVSVPVFHSVPARVKVGGSITQNLGDYNSARVEVSVEMPCLPEKTEILRTYTLVSVEVDRLLRRELALATGVGQAEQVYP